MISKLYNAHFAFLKDKMFCFIFLREFTKRNDPKTCKDYSLKKTIMLREKEAAEKNVASILEEIERKKR